MAIPKAVAIEAEQVGMAVGTAIGITAKVTIGSAINLAVGGFAIIGTVTIIAMTIIAMTIFAVRILTMGIIAVGIVTMGVIAMGVIAMRGGARGGLVAFDEPITDGRARCRAVVGIAAGILLAAMVA